jgi:hypothetical protein
VPRSGVRDMLRDASGGVTPEAQSMRINCRWH